MKFEPCAIHRGTDCDDLPCLRIRHDDVRVATEREIWDALQMAEEDAALWEEHARHIGWRDEREAAR